MTKEEITDFQFLSPIVTYLDFVQNKQYFRQIAQRLREHSTASDTLPQTSQTNDIVEHQNPSTSFEKALQLTQQKYADIINALADK
ncbi:hypothetical protein [Arsenophonus sp. ENCA]|uniref:hypothetical protein n=1 Tax=Arsenophonus sp. ENCA TaxID=1987579 RepID=UPI0025BCC082|nr:hypothetical protein [Arsenophonus sp. ENCA]